MCIEMKQVKEEKSVSTDKATEWLNSLKASTRKPYTTAWKYFREFTGMTGDEIIEDRKNDKEHKWERKVLEFKQWLMDKKGLAPYTATASTNSVRGFFAYYYSKLEYRRADRKRIGERTRKTEDYFFTIEDLKLMADHANLHEKYVLVAGKSFGLRAGDFLRLTRGDLEPYIERPVPINIGKIDTGKEKVPAYPFIDADTQPIIKHMLAEMDREGRTKPTDRILTYNWEKELTETLKRLAKKAGLKTGNKRVRFHCLRKFLIDNISSLMSESKWKQIVGKKVSEGAYVSSDSLRDDYARAMSKTTFTKTVAEGDIELLAKKQALIMLAKLQGASEADVKKIFRSKKAVTTKEQVKVLEEFTEQNKPSNNNCADGEHCQRIVKETELKPLLTQGWHVTAILPSGKIVVSNKN
jgi:integrase